MVSMGGQALPVGATVSFTTITNCYVEGQVVCFDPTLKVLVIRDKDAVTKKTLVRVFNLNAVSEIKLKSEPSNVQLVEDLLSACNFNGKKVNERITTLSGLRHSELMPSDKISMNGQKVFLQLKKTIADTRWDGENIRVVGMISVKAPYAGENVEIIKSEVHTDSDESRARTALAQVRKILSKPFTISDERQRHEIFTAPAISI